MFEGLVEVANRSRGAAAIGGWARVENAAAARRLSAMADLLANKLADDDSAERDQWCLDNWDAVSAEVAAWQQVSIGVASNELLDAWMLRERLPRVAEVFASGAVNYRLVRSVVKRTRLVSDPEAMAKIDIEIAAQITDWGPLAKAKQEAAIDYWVDRYDPAAVVRAEAAARSRHVDVTPAADGSGTCFVEAVLHGHDGEVLDRRLDEIAQSVCEADPRTLDQRRADAMRAMAEKWDRLPCLCGAQECAATPRPKSSIVVHVITEESSLTDQTPVALHGERPAPLKTEPEKSEPEKPGSTALLAPPPAIVLGGGLVPGPVVAATLAQTATIRPLIHPGESPPEPRYVPSAKLADFVRCRDMTCRFPGCDVPAYACDLDHTIPYPVGPTQASNLASLCRKHHLLKTFWGWRGVQSPDGAVVWTAPGGQTFTTHPGSRILFPALCRPTAPVVVPPSRRVAAMDTPPGLRPSGLGMPRRTETRAQGRARRIAEQRAENEALLELRDDDPPW
ncbi:HNH endonuclease [Mycolicibacterium parafortuitum]|uniref:HNH endonuclease signature motif containing protein n=1 Tax=Mycolicibacterium parafortuitum TaxID=39692 RepID=UPI0032C4209D